MVHRKGEITPRIVRREYPWFCEVPVPPGGLGRRYEELLRWCGSTFGRYGYGETSLQEKQERGMPIEYVQFRFKTEEHANVFRATFGGRVGNEAEGRRRR